MRVIFASPIFFRNLRNCLTCSRFKSHFVSCNSPFLPLFARRLQISPPFSVLTSVSRQFSSFENGKIFKEKENEHAHGVMEKSNKYNQTVLKFPLSADININSSKDSNAFSSFVDVTVKDSSSSNIEDPTYSPLIRQMCSLLPEATDVQVQTVLHYLSMWPPTATTHTPNFKSLWNTLDQVCTKRCRSWDVSYRLLIADYWFGLRLNRITQYNKELICSLLEDCKSLTSQQLVQLMFYVNLQRELPGQFLPNLEQKITEIMPTISIEELGIVCLAYFKTKNKVANADLIQSVVKHFVANIEKVPTVTVAAVLKFLRKSLQLALVDVYILALHKSIPYIKSWDIPTSVHSALLSSECNIYHPLLLSNVADKLTNEMDQARIKDCTKLSLCLTHFNHFEEDFYDALMAELKKDSRKNELLLYVRDIPYISLYYAYMGRYDYEILSKLFRTDFVERCRSRCSEIFHTFIELDYCIEIECDDYNGPRLELSARKHLNRRGNLPGSSKHQNFQTRLISNVHDSLKDIFGSDENIVTRHILPHVYSPDVVLQLPNQTKKSVSVKEVCQNTPPEVILKPPEGEIWLAFVVCGAFSFAHRSKQMTGVTAMKLRQLQKLGYQVVFVPFYELPQNSLSRKKYISQLIDSSQKHASNSS